MAIVTTYKCTQCGTRLVVTEDMESHLSPVYCCGIQVAEVASMKAVPKPGKKTAKKKAAKKKKPVAKKKK